METQLRERNQEVLTMRETINRLETENNILERETKKLKLRVSKLRLRKEDKNSLMCKNCGKDF